MVLSRSTIPGRERTLTALEADGFPHLWDLSISQYLYQGGQKTQGSLTVETSCRHTSGSLKKVVFGP